MTDTFNMFLRYIIFAVGMRYGLSENELEMWTGAAAAGSSLVWALYATGRIERFKNFVKSWFQG